MRTITVDAKVVRATAYPDTDTGAIVSLLDLLGRQLALVGLTSAKVQGIDQLDFTADQGGGRFWAALSANEGETVG